MPTTSLAEIDTALQRLGARPEHRSRLLRHWLQAIPLDRGRNPLAHYLPKALHEALPALMAEWQGLAALHAREPSEDSSERLLLRLHDGQSVEAVLLPRGGLCISSQVGCAVGCGFCMTGTLGLIRQVGSAELLAQVATARTLRAVNKVVFMGMGEPGAQPRRRAGRHRHPGPPRAASATRTWCSAPWATSACSSAWAVAW